MKNLLICMITCLTFYSAKSQTIDGQFKGEPSTEMIYLNYYPDLMGSKFKEAQMDSSLIRNGRFHFDFKVGEVPKFAKLIQMKRNKESGMKENLGEIMFFLTNDSIVIYTNDSLKNAKVLNSSVNYDAAILKEMINVADQKVIYLTRSRNIESKEIPVKISKSMFHSRFQFKRMNILTTEKAMLYSKFIKENPYSWISLYAFQIILSRNEPSMITTEIVQLYNGLGNKLKNSDIGIDLAKRIEAKNKVRIGAGAPLFQLRDTSGILVNLSDYLGKYVLLEFWASWCGPCRFETPFLKSAYAKYQQKGFDILSVSIDEEGLRYSGRSAWLKAIKDDGIGLWKHVSDLKGSKSPVTMMYDIVAIPQNFLIDPSGKIISENLKGADLHDKLEDIFYKN